MKKRPYIPILALILIWLGTLAEWYWMWGLLFLFWTVPAYYSGRIQLIEDVERAQHPILFWAILATWVLLSLFWILYDIYLLVGGWF